MKMKKLFLTIVVVALLLSTTVVRAATAEGTLSSDKTEYKKGDTVTLTLTMAKTSNTNGVLKYNKDQFTFQSVKVNAEGATISKSDTEDGIKFFAMPISSENSEFTTVTFTFTVASEEEATSGFEVSDFNPGEGSGATVDNSAVSAISLNKPQQPTPDEPATTPDDNTPSTSDPVKDEPTGNPAGESGNPTTESTKGTESEVKAPAESTMPTVIPQAGVPYVVIGVVLAIIAIAFISVKSKRK